MLSQYPGTGWDGVSLRRWSHGISSWNFVNDWMVWASMDSLQLGIRASNRWPETRWIVHKLGHVYPVKKMRIAEVKETNNVKESKKRPHFKNGSSVSNVAVESNKINTVVDLCGFLVLLVMYFSFPSFSGKPYLRYCWFIWFGLSEPQPLVPWCKQSSTPWVQKGTVSQPGQWDSITGISLEQMVMRWKPGPFKFCEPMNAFFSYVNLSCFSAIYD